jgi:hypothetical protein
MGRRLLLTLAALVPVSLVMAQGIKANGIKSGVDLRVHDAGLCWEPDVEFPVPCDDDDD